MGTYIYARLMRKDEQSIKQANEALANFGYPTETHNGVQYGFFNSRAALQEDARFMNEDPEGIKQVPHMKRPITVEDLQGFFWNEVGCGIIKITGITPDSKDEELVKLVYRWLQTAEAKRLLDLEASELHMDRAGDWLNSESSESKELLAEVLEKIQQNGSLDHVTHEELIERIERHLQS